MIPKGKTATAVQMWSNALVPVKSYSSSITTGSVSGALIDSHNGSGGDAKLTLSRNIVGDGYTYIIIELEPIASTIEIYGGAISIQDS